MQSSAEERGPRNFRGTRDYVGRDYNIRKWATDIIAWTFEQFGFQPLETPILELEDTLRGKYGEEGEANWFRLSAVDEQRAGMRYDQTVPLARFMAMNWNAFPMPFRRYVIGPVFRKETVQAGRYRQFVQCDFDTVGSTNPIIDAEVVAMNAMVLSRLGFTDQFQVQVNDRRLLDAIATDMGFENPEIVMAMFRAWDKLGKQSLQEVFDYFVGQVLDIQLGGKEIGDEERRRRLSVLKLDNDSFLDKTDQLLALEGMPIDVQLSRVAGLFPSARVGEAINGLDQLFNMITAMGVSEARYSFRPLLARGLDYYTGPIFETMVQGGTVSITGGGRFDHLVESLGGPDLPASGSSFGLERVISIMEEYGILPELPTVPAEVFAVVFDFANADLMRYLFDTVTGLRLTGLKVEVYTGDTQLRLGKQMDIARRKNVPITLLVGEDEMNSGNAAFKVLSTGEQFTVSVEELAESLKQYL